MTFDDMKNLFLAFLLSLALAATSACATNVEVVGLFPGKAVLVVNSGSPKTYSVGAIISPGVKLVASSDSSATLEVNGKREVLALGQYGGGSGGDDGGSALLSADFRGHFTAEGQINGGTVRMLVDTGASMVAIPAHDASRLGIDYRSGAPTMISTANGVAPAYRVKLDTVQVGSIVLHQVDAMVMERGLPVILLGMSFLNRTEMQRSGDRMTLKKRF